MRTYLIGLLRFSFMIGAIPVIVIGLFSYYIASSDIENKVKDSNMQLLLQTQMRVEQMVKTLQTGALQFSQTSLVKQALDETWTPRDFVKVREMAKGLSNLQTSVMVHQAYFVNLEREWLVGYNQFKPLDEYEDRKAIESFAAHPNSLFFASGESIGETGASFETGEFPETAGRPETNSETLTMVQKIPLISNAPPRGLLVVQLLKKDVESLLADTDTLGLHYMIDGEGNDLLQTLPITEPKKEMLAETYRAIHRDIWSRIRDGQMTEGTFDARLGGDPVIVTYRSSPGGDWAYVSVSSVSEMTKQTKAIALLTIGVCLLIFALVFGLAFYGSRRMYMPIQKLLDLTRQLGAEPEAPGESRRQNEMLRIEDSIRSLWTTKSELQRQVHSQFGHLKELLVLKLFTGQIKAQHFLAQSKTFAFPEAWNRLFVMTVQIDTLQNTHYGEHDRELLLFAVSNIVSEMIPSSERFDPVLLDQSQSTLLADRSDSPQEGKERAYRTAESVQKQVEHYLKLTVSIGISRPFADLADTVKAYGESLAALKGRMSLGNGIIAGFDDSGKRSREETAVYSHLKVMEERIVHYLKAGDAEKRDEAFDEYLAAVFEKEVFFKEHVLLLLQLVGKIVQLVQEQGIAAGNWLNGEQIARKLLTLGTRAEVVLWFRERLFGPVSEMLSQQAESQYQSIASLMLKFVHEGYDSEISLESCAALLRYHPVYLSRVFKKEVGVTFSEYLTEYRMNKAKDMLENTKMKIAEIGEKLQYKNTSAFIRTFSKTTGTTPGKYRESRQQL